MMTMAMFVQTRHLIVFTITSNTLIKSLLLFFLLLATHVITRDSPEMILDSDQSVILYREQPSFINGLSST